MRPTLPVLRGTPHASDKHPQQASRRAQPRRSSVSSDSNLSSSDTPGEGGAYTASQHVQHRGHPLTVCRGALLLTPTP